MKALVVETERAWQALGQVTYGAGGSETSSMRFRRSLYVVEDVKEGEELTQNNIRAIQPGWGLPPKYIENIIGKQAGKALKRGTPVSWDIL